MEINLDAPTVSAIDLSAELEPEPAAETPAAVPAPEAEAPPAAEAKPTSDENDDRVIELTRRNREASRARSDAEAKVAEAQAQVAKLEPIVELMKLADTDPLAFITEIADAVGLDPARVLDVMGRKGAGDDVALTPDDRIALLQRQIEEMRAEREEKPAAEPTTTEGEQARTNFVTSLQSTIEAAPEKFPLCADEPTAADAAFLVMVKHWSANKATPGYRPLEFSAALDAVEKSLRSETTRRAERIGIKSTPAQAAPPPAKAPSGGLSTSMTGPVVPSPRNVVLSDDEIAANVLREIGLGR